RFNDLLRACPHHGFSELHQLDTFYNALNFNDKDSLNSAAGGNFLDKMSLDCLRIIESKSKVRNSRNKPVVAKVSTSNSTPGISPDVSELKDMVKALLLDKKNQSQAPATVKVVEDNCVTCSGAHSYRNCPATDGNVYRDNIQEYVSQAAAANFNQGNTGYRAPISNQIRPPGFPPVQQNQGNNQNLGNNYNQGPIYQPPVNQAQIYRPPINQHPVHQAPPYQAPAPQTQVPKTSPVVQVQPQVPNSEPVVAPVSAPKPNLKPSIPYPSRLNDQKIREKANNQIEKFYQIFQDLHFDNSFADALILMPKFASTLKSLISNKEKLMDECLALADLGASKNLMPLSVCKKLSLPELTPTCMTLELADRSITQPIEVLGFSDVIASGNPTPYYDSIVSTSSLTLTPFGDSDFLLEEVNAFLALEDDPTLPEVDHSYYDPEGDILLLEEFLNDDPSLPPSTQGNYLLEIRKELKVCEAKNDKSSIDEPLKVELKDLPPHLEYAFLEGDDKLPVIITKDLSVEEKAALIKVLKSHKRAIAWKLSDIKERGSLRDDEKPPCRERTIRQVGKDEHRGRRSFKEGGM
ncbi:hypothetical protein Tco_0360217, partial [Tanacetum coccineum]